MSLVPNRLFCECCGEYCANDEDFLLHLRGHQTEEQEFFAELQRQRVEGFDAEVSTTEEGIEGPSELPEEGAREDGASVEESGSSRISRANKGEDESGGEGVQQPSEAAQTTDDTGALQVRGGGAEAGQRMSADEPVGAGVPKGEHANATGTEFYEDFQWRDGSVRVKQDTLQGHAAVLWDAARVLAKFLEIQPVAWSGKKVLDLGSGCGLTALCVGKDGAAVTMTELPGFTRVLRENAEANLPAGGPWAVRDMVWGTPGKETDWGPATDLGSDWDYVIGSDLIYSDKSTPALMETLKHCCGPRTEVILSFELRRAADLDFIRGLASHGFAYIKVPPEQQHPVWQAEEIGIFRIQRVC